MRVTEYPPGTPCWLDLSSPDLPAARAFYTGLFGWTAHTSPDPATGGYTIFHLDDDPVAAVGPSLDPAQPPGWRWYAATTDLDATATRVRGAGGTELVPPTDIPAAGRMAVFLDATGTQFAAWQAGPFLGARRVNEPGTFVWNELITRDPAGAQEFYAAALGWTAQASGVGGGDYTEFQVAGRSVAGLMPMTGDLWPADLPSHWMVYFAVADCQASCERVRELGGMLSVPPTDTPVGRFAVVGDQHRAPFSIIQLAAG